MAAQLSPQKMSKIVPQLRSVIRVRKAMRKAPFANNLPRVDRSIGFSLILFTNSALQAVDLDRHL